MIILDTNVLSEFMRPRPSVAVLRWLDVQAREAVWANSVSLTELRFGVQLVREPVRRLELDRALTSVMASELDGRIVPFDSQAAECTARISAIARQTGKTIELRDAMIAGIVECKNATLATRNIRHFQGTGITLVDPWTA